VDSLCGHVSKATVTQRWCSRLLSVLNASAKVKFVGHEVCRPAREAIHHVAGVKYPLMGSLAWASQPLAGSSRPVQQSNAMKQIRLGLPGQRCRRPRPKAKNAATSPSPRSPPDAATSPDGCSQRQIRLLGRCVRGPPHDRVLRPRRSCPCRGRSQRAFPSPTAHRSSRWPCSDPRR
jgi:hypothetical protein